MKNRSIRLDEELEKWLEQKSKMYGVGISSVIRILLNELKFKEEFQKEVDNLKGKKTKWK